MPVAIEFKSDTVNIVEARSKSGGFDLRKVKTVTFPEEWLDSQGIREMDDMYLLLMQTLEDAEINTKDAFLCINNSSIIYRELVVPNIESKKLAMIVRSEMMDVLNLTPDYIMDYVVIEEFTDEKGADMIRVLAVACLSAVLASYIMLMKRLKLKLISIDSATNSVLKIVSDVADLKSLEQMILVDVGNGHLRLYLFELGKYVLSRNTKLAHLKESSRQEIINVIEDNINKMIQFSYTRGNKAGIKKIVLAGKDELLEELKLKILDDLLVPCEVLQKPGFIGGEALFETRYINVLGALIRK